MGQPSAYEILGVNPNASEADIRMAYRMRAKRMHPDQAGEGAHEGFLALKAAYELLIDPLQRQRYDQDPEGVFERQLDQERRRAQLRRRRRRLQRLWRD